jgi:aryl-alcohol dehydrogenase-like predicted oxidoreductase
MATQIKRELGKSGIYVHPLGTGCWSFGGGAYWGTQNQEDVNNTVAAALDAGVNFFDTAEAYNDGTSETSLGAALRNRRSEAIVATKISPSNVRSLEAHLDASLRRLGMDYVDVYMLHWPITTLGLKHFSEDAALLSAPPNHEECFAALQKMLRKGKIRAVGVSNFGARQLREVLSFGVPIAVNEIAYNIISRAIEREIAPLCAENGISVIGSMALQQGVLAGIYGRAEEIPAAQAHSRHFHQTRGGAQSRHFEDGAETEIFALLPALKALADDLGLSMAALSIAWVLSRAYVGATLCGSRNIGQLQENLQACAIALPADVVARIDALSEPVWKKLGDAADYYENRKDTRTF